MAKKKPLPLNIIAIGIIIALGIVAVVIFQDQVLGFALGLEERFKTITDIPENIPPTLDDDTLPIAETPPTPDPEGFQISKDDLITVFLENLGLTQIETFNILIETDLIDANLESVVQQSFLRVQPLDPTEVIVDVSGELDPSRFFINTDFSTQLADNGRNYHQYSGWNIIQDFGGASGIPVSITVTQNCRVPDTGKCIQVSGSKNKDDDAHNGSVFHGISKTIDISDWTREGELIVEIDYDCNTSFLRNARFLAIITGDGSEQHILQCASGQHFKRTVSSSTIGDNNGLRVSFGAQALNVDGFRMDIQFNNAQVIGNSVAKREAIGILETLSIVQNDQEQRILNLGFIETNLVGETLMDGERVTITGVLEARIDDKTTSVHDITGSGITVNNQIPLRIEGMDSLVFVLDEQNFQGDSFHTLKFIIDDVIANVGEGANQRTFEYHTPFIAYFLEFNVLDNRITGFNQLNRAIVYPVSDSVFQSCGITANPSNSLPEILPPVINIIQNGFTIAVTEPTAGIIGQLGENEEFCSVIPDLPRDTTITFKVQDNFFDVSTPINQMNYFLKCDRSGCNSNIGFSEVFP